jgi:nicotinate-nucleotide adenylyltransferase
MLQPVGILGGTFDPVHNGHLHLATTFLETLNLAELRFIPLNTPPHRTAPFASAEQRLEMLGLAIENQPDMKIDDCEIRRGGISYTIDTLKHLRKILDKTSLCLLMGMENFNTLNHWRQWRSLSNYAHIVIADRPGSNNKLTNNEMKNFLDDNITQSVETLHQQPAGLIMQLDIPMLDISSTQIRNNIQTNLKSDSLLPNKVLDFIQAHDLYKS